MLAILVVLTAAAADFVPLPGGPPVETDYLAYDPGSHRLFIPAGNTGKVDVLDTATGKLSSIDGWPTSQAGNRAAGPSAATVGAEHLYVGNRAGSAICAVDLRMLSRKGCVTMPSSPDGVFFVGPTREVWVTLPRRNELVILSLADPAAPKLAGAIALPGEPEGYAVDEQRGRVVTNLRDKDRTVVIDAKARTVLANHEAGCGGGGPRGIAVDPQTHLRFVACSGGGVRAFDDGGKLASELKTGPGVDNIDYLPARRRVYVASGKDGMLTVAEVGPDGAMKPFSTASTAPGARTVIVDQAGTAYVPDSTHGRLIVVRPERGR